MRKVDVKKKRFIEQCSYCSKEITGNSESQCLYNLSIHIKQKHGKGEK